MVDLFTITHNPKKGARVALYPRGCINHTVNWIS